MGCANHLMCYFCFVPVLPLFKRETKCLEKSDDFFRLYRQYAAELDSSRFSVTKFSCIFLYSTVVCVNVFILDFLGSSIFLSLFDNLSPLVKFQAVYNIEG